ncbi:MAG: alpha/beta hydrolase [Desulfovibrio sp.]|uniref:alpha/beta hydrolase n=1 Tax=Desulfovibrio sp. 7SRBS1 TaxID=3378064 RepID=UPI003B40956E
MKTVWKPFGLVLFVCMLQICVLLCPWAGDAKAYDAHATSYGYVFKDGDMDFHFGNLALGSAVNHGVEVGEAFYVASQIEDGDAASWNKEWYGLAQRAEARGEKSLAAGHTVSAREQLLRAAYAYRLSLIGMLPDNPEMLKRGLKCRSLMKKVGTLFDPPLEYFEIPFEGTVLPGFFRAAAGKGPHKTLLMIGGGETFIEDLYFYIAPQAFERGYNFMTVDLPGQGLMPFAGKVFRTDTNVAMKPVVDYALSRADVDPRYLAAYGISGGGLFVPQAAQHDPRIKAIAMNSGVVDAEALFATMPAALASKEEMASWSSFHRDVVRSICWRYGVDEPAGLIPANKGNTFDPAKIAVPALIIAGEGEYKSDEVQRQQQIAMDNFPNPKKKMVITPTNEGATNHCVMENRSLVGQVLFDWLDESFK